MMRGGGSEEASASFEEEHEPQARQGQNPDGELQVLYQRYNRPIYNLFANYGCAREECRDLVQDTFVEVHRSATGFRGKSSASTWIFAIAKNVFLQRLRSRSRLKRHAEHLPIDHLSESDQESALQGREKTLENLIVNEKVQLLREALASLPDRMRLCALLYFFQSRTSSEIATILHIAEGTVRSQLSQARERLKERLAEHFPDIL